MKTSKAINSRTRAINVATAAPLMDSSGKPNLPKINTHESRVFIASASEPMRVGVFTSPVERMTMAKLPVIAVIKKDQEKMRMYPTPSPITAGSLE